MLGGQRSKLPHLDRGATEHNNFMQGSQYDVEDPFAMAAAGHQYYEQSITDCNSTSEN